MLVVILTGQRVGLRPCPQVIDGGIEHEVHERLAVGQHLTYLFQPVLVGTVLQTRHVLDGAGHLGSTVLLHLAFQHIIVVGSLQLYRPLVLLLELRQRRVVIGNRLVAVDNLHGLALVGIVADAEFAVIIVHKLTVAVSRTRQQIVETLVILHQIRYDVLLLPSQQVFHLGGVALHALVLHIRQLKVGQLLLEDVAAELLSRERTAVLRQRQQLVGAVDLQHHLHLVGLLTGDELVHVEVLAHRIGHFLVVLIPVAISQRHPLIGKHIEEVHLAEVHLLGSPVDIRRGDQDFSLYLVRAVHLLLKLEGAEREREVHIHSSSLFPFCIFGRKVPL